MAWTARRAFVLGGIALLVAEAVVGALVVASGVVDVAATAAGGVQDRVLAYASLRSIAHHAPREQNPVANDPAALKAGLARYRAMCLDCHGAPGSPPEEFAAGLHPAPPDLASPAVQSFTDGMLYEVVARGIGSTGMPAFGTTHRPEELWSIVAFVRHLGALTPDEKRELARAGEREGGGEGEAHGATSHEHAARGHEAAAGSGSASGVSGAVEEGKVHRVSISGFRFTPSVLEVHAGDVVEWTNADLAPHTATADDRAFETGDIPAGGVKRVVATAKGRHAYSCRYHPSMKGTLVVE